MTYTYKSCPHCGHQYENYNTMTKSYTVSDGCPIITCKYCNRKFVDKDIKEPAFFSKPSKTNTFELIIAPLYFLGIPLFLSYGIAIKNSNIFSLVVAIVLSIIYIWFVCRSIKVKKDINTDFIKEYEESRIRCSNREYIVFLIDSGYKVPEYFLEVNYPDLLNYQRKHKKYKTDCNIDNSKQTKNSECMEDKNHSSKTNGDIETSTDTKQKNDKIINTQNNFCRKCGVKLNEDAEFCHKCGTKVITFEDVKK